VNTNLSGENSTCLLEFLTNLEKNLTDISSKVQLLIDKSQGDVIQSGGVKTVNYYNGNPVHSVADYSSGYLPSQLETDQGLRIKEALIDAGLIDDSWQPIGLTGSQRGLLAGTIAQTLDIRNQWQLFGRLWDEKPDTLRKYYNRAFDQSKSLDFQDLLKTIMAQ
jgi:hypothetical protein